MSESQAAVQEARVALVTGASRGIGRAIADALAAAGHTVIGTATSASGAAAIEERLAASGGAGLCLDVADGHSVTAMSGAIAERFAAPLILVNNAGITRDNLLLRMKEDEWRDVLETNLNALYRMSRAVLRGMTKARWGRIVNITSVVGSMGNAGQANYAASKSGAEGFARALARELGARGVTVNAVAPGFIDTDMTRALTDEQRASMLAQIPLARLGQADEIGALVAFLCSEQAAYITGETIHINGGLYMG